MYSSSEIAVDKGLGIDFSEIVTGVTETVKSALPLGLNIYQKQMQINAMKQPGYNAFQSPSVYGNPYNILPINKAVPLQSNVPMPYYPQSSGMDTTTMLLIGAGLLLGGVVLLKAAR